MKEPRFRPPACPPSPETSWVLRRAFGPLGGAVPAPERPAAVLDAARRTALAARIASRVEAATLAAELGDEVARSFMRDAAVCAAQTARLGAVAGEVEAVAAEAGVPIAWLKFVALTRSGVVKAGGRWAADVDVLAPAAAAEALQRALERHGFVAGASEYEHQLPALTSPLGGSVEVHRKVLGVRLGRGRASATFEALRDAGLLGDGSSATGERRGNVFLPAKAVVVAHAVAHGLGQHGFEPEAYPPWRMVADLVDLGFGAGDVINPGLVGWLARAVPEAELRGLAELCRRLAAGESPRVGDSSAADLLLDHFLAGTFDDAYRASLKLQRMGSTLSDAPRAIAVARAAVRALFPSRGELVAIYHPRSPAGLWWRRVTRPLDVLWRTVRVASGRHPTTSPASSRTGGRDAI